uniref:Uncharacterized protein n=1 Tax=Vitis vinifera TaxID=29760 RepID=F6H999_VITVI
MRRLIGQLKDAYAIQSFEHDIVA